MKNFRLLFFTEARGTENPWNYLLFVSWGPGGGTRRTRRPSLPRLPLLTPTASEGEIEPTSRVTQLAELVAVPVGTKVAAPTGVTLAGVP